MAVATKPPAPSRVTPHQFDPDEAMGVEAWVPLAERGRPPRRWCRHCGLLGEPGDERHPNAALPPPPVDPATAAAWRAHDEQIWGEHERDEEENSGS